MKKPAVFSATNAARGKLATSRPVIYVKGFPSEIPRSTVLYKFLHQARASNCTMTVFYSRQQNCDIFRKNCRLISILLHGRFKEVKCWSKTPFKSRAGGCCSKYGQYWQNTCCKTSIRYTIQLFKICFFGKKQNELPGNCGSLFIVKRTGFRKRRKTAWLKCSFYRF